MRCLWWSSALPTFDSTLQQTCRATNIFQIISPCLDSKCDPDASASAPGTRETMAFVLPSKMTMETAPTPTNPNVALRQVPSRTCAVHKFSGTANPMIAAQKVKVPPTLFPRGKKTALVSCATHWKEFTLSKVEPSFPLQKLFLFPQPCGSFPESYALNPDRRTGSPSSSCRRAIHPSRAQSGIWRSTTPHGRSPSSAPTKSLSLLRADLMA